MNPQAPSSEMSTPTILNNGRIASLDGLRAVSIALVMLSHLCGTRHFLGYHSLDSLGDLGQLGVRIFFVISGFLITTLLLRELERTGRISLGDFYMRRFLRIFPAYYVLLACVALCKYMNLVYLRPGDLPNALIYTSNYHHNHAWLLGHTWSLAVEEQFYLIWPLALCIVGKRWGMILAATCLMLCPLLRTVIWLWEPALRGGIGMSFPTIADALATGCLLAGCRGWLGSRSSYMSLLSSKAFIVVPAAVLAANMFGRSPRISYPGGQTIINIGIALVLDWSIRFAHCGIGRLLNAKGLVWLGTLSYSLYLWQQPFLDRTGLGPTPAFPANIVAAVITAAVSYYVVEAPMLRFRKRLVARQQPPEKAEIVGAVIAPAP